MCGMARRAARASTRIGRASRSCSTSLPSCPTIPSTRRRYICCMLIFFCYVICFVFFFFCRFAIIACADSGRAAGALARDRQRHHDHRLPGGPHAGSGRPHLRRRPSYRFALPSLTPISTSIFCVCCIDRPDVIVVVQPIVKAGQPTRYRVRHSPSVAV